MKVKACAIDRIHVYYDCPYCKMKHQHGSGDDLSNRVMDERISHCHLKHNVEGDTMVEITIDDNTKRLKLSKAILKRNKLI